MKKLFLFLIGLLMAGSLAAQETIYISNTLPCDLLVQMYEVDAACNNTAAVNYIVPAGSAITVNANPGHQYIYAEVHTWPFCTGGVAMAIGTPGPCTFCTWGAPFNPSYANSGCNGCPPVVNGYWACSGGTTGVIRFY